jgi:hypothetical protein
VPPADRVPPAERARRIARRAFVAAWILLGILGALNHTVAERTAGRRWDLALPHLRYGYVMFNENPRTVRTFEYARPGGERRPLAELVPSTSLGYSRARLAITVAQKPIYLAEVCLKLHLPAGQELTFYVDEYQVDVDPRRPARTFTYRCDAHGLAR